LRISPEGSTEVTPPADWPQKGEITFKNVQLRYRPDCELVLTDLTYTAEAGHKVGIVGRTGCGKSTMGLALSRLVEIEGGLVCIDGIEVSKVDLTLLRSKITVIP
jgi:ATP-binding cassette subfamily C (CFTR/MRP) protein 5